MGWINEAEQENVLKLYGFKAQYRCDYKLCGLPIFLHQLMTEDRKGGYYPRKDDPTKTFTQSRAKRTYHYQCDVIRRLGKLPPEPLLVMNGNRRARLRTASSSATEKIARQILKTVQSKSKGWTVPRLIKHFGWEDTKKRKRLLKNIVLDLRTLGYLSRRGGVFKTASKKKKESESPND